MGLGEILKMLHSQSQRRPLDFKLINSFKLEVASGTAAELGRPYQWPGGRRGRGTHFFSIPVYNLREHFFLQSRLDS
jgi:hypothetical protein